MGDMLDTSKLEAFAASGPDGPFRLLTLLRFKPAAQYPGGASGDALTGREAYARYLDGLRSLVESVGGRIEHYGHFHGVLLGSMQEQYDAMSLVRYPDRSALMKMLGSFDYTRIAPHRVAALDDSVVLAMPDATAPE